MRAPKPALRCLLLLTVFAGMSAAAHIELYMMLKTPPASCGAAIQNPPTPVTSFLATDNEAYLWFYVTGVNAGDVASSEYFTPSGNFYQPASGSWDPTAQGGNYCFTDAPFQIAGQSPASMPGVWTVKVIYNGTPLFTLTFSVGSSGSTGTTLTVDATANIFAAGRDTAFSGTLPASFQFTAGSGAAISFSQVTGSVNCTVGAVMNGPDGSTSCAGGATNINAYQGISGIVDAGKAMFLTGVFLDNSIPANAPPALNFTGNESFTSLAPQMWQTFFIGDGLTGAGGGSPQQFLVPTGATRLFLGFADAFGFQGDPGYYEDNSGSISATVAITGGQPAGACTYAINLASQSFSASGGNGTVTVGAGTGCAWTAQSNDSWITISAGATGSGNGTVSYSVAADGTQAARTGTLTIGGQTYTVSEAASTCTYNLSPGGASAASGGVTGAVLIVTSGYCSWTASSNAAWITINSDASGAGNATVSYTVAANPSTSSRSGTLSLGGRAFTVTQAGAAAAGAPAISPNGVINAASYMPANLPGGAIARGSLFSIFGTALGPILPAQATKFPLGATLAGTSVRISGSTSADALPLYVSAGQINAVMPSNAPLGDVQITVTYNGVTSAPAALTVANNNFGAFNVGGGRGPGVFQNYISGSQQPLNSRSHSAKPKQVVTLWGTGLGPISAPDNVAPPAGNLPLDVQVLVGGISAHRLYSGRAPCCAGVDQIVFEVPADAPQGCYVPVQVKTGQASYSNAVTMAIDAKGKSCSDPANPFASDAATGGKFGSVFLVRAGASLQVDAASPPVDITVDLGVGLFLKTPPGGDLAFNPFSSLPPVGTCSAYTNNLDLNQVLSAGIDVSKDSGGLLNGELDAGPALSIAGPGGNSIAAPRVDDNQTIGPYVGLLGGQIPLDGMPVSPLFLNGGSYTITGPGGKDVGPFTASVILPAPAKWTNRDQISTVDRSAGITVTWTGGDANSELVLIAGGSVNQITNAAAGFFCFAPLAAGSFTVPASVLGNLPPNSAASPEDTVGALLVGTVPGSGFSTFAATGLDSGMVFYGTLDFKTVAVQ